MAGVLEGLKVVSVEHYVAIPAATVWMADWGAEVIKVEPLTGDMYRGTGRAGGAGRAVKLGNTEVNWGIQLINRNKKSLALDLKKNSGRDILYKLIKGADVFMSNYQLDAVKKLGLDYNTLSRINPGLIYAFLSGYGTVGPDKDEPGFDNTASWARSGMQYLIGEPGSPPPAQRGGMGDRTAAPHVVAGVLAALLHREKTGKGQELEFSLYHSAVWTLAVDIQSALAGTSPNKDDRTKAQNPLWNSYRAKGDRWLQLGMTQSDVYWPNVCRAIDRPELENDPRFAGMNVRRENCQELIRIMDEVFASRTREEWERGLREQGCIYGRIQTPDEVIVDPQALANDFFVDLNHPDGRMNVVASPVKFRQNPATVRGPAPEIGQNTEEIFLELGYGWEDIAGLKEQNVIL